MHSKFRLVAFFIIVLAACGACSTVPITGRTQFNVIPDQTMLSMSFQQYDQFLEKNKVSTDQEKTAMVKRVGNRIAKAVEQYFTQNGLASELGNYDWEFNLVEDDQINAWCMPGGKVVVYTGILPVARDDAGLAVVMGHEIAHAVAEHGNERMSHGLAVQMGGVALSTALSTQTAQTQQLWMSVFGVGSQYGFMLPYGRLQENEADELGLVFMAMAGYDPNAAVAFWQRMSEQKGGEAPPEFLSTHPSDETRIQRIKEQIPKVMPYYRQAM